MGLGLQIWDASGTQVLDTSWRMGRVLGQLTANGTNGSVNIPDLSQGTPWAIAITNGAQTISVPPVTSFSGTTLNWSYDQGTGGTVYAATIIYGVY